MKTITPDSRQEDWEALQDDQARLAPRPRREIFNRRSAALGALVACAIGFYAGVRVEKSQQPAAASAAAGAAGSRSGFAGLLGGGGGTGGGTAGSGSSFGTVTSVRGATLYVSEVSGNTVKVVLSSATKITKTKTATRSAIRPGDSVVVSGVSGAGGRLTAASVTDSGAGRGAAAGAGGGSGASSSGSASGSGSSGSSGSGVGSLFSSGG
jgi:hypothetical protein